MKTRLVLRLLAGASLLLSTCFLANAQSTPSSLPLPDMAGNTLPLNSNRMGAVQVYVRTEDGEPLATAPKVTMITPSSSVPIPIMQKGGEDNWIFNGVELGTIYQLQVQASGYHTELRAVRVLNSDTATESLIVFMRSPNDELSFHPPSGQFVLSPEAEKETQKGATDLDSGKIASAQKHLARALELSPGNPYVNYLMGMRFLVNGELPAAKPYLEKSVSADARQVPALVALGTLRFRQQDYAGAIQVLVPALQLGGSKWKIHSMLAGSYLRQQDFEHAREQAEKSLALGGKDAGRDNLVLGEALAALGQRDKAVTALEAFLNAYPNDNNDPTIRTWIPDLKKPQPAGSAATHLSIVAAAPVDLPPKADWAPPDVDAEKPFIVSGATCSMPAVLKMAGKSATQLVTDLQEFTANEKYESIEIKRDQALVKPESRNFNYLVFIENPRPDILSVEEMRDQGVNAIDMPGRSVDKDAALALVFHPVVQNDFAWTCEGLGEWKDQPAWIVHFAQRSDRPDILASFQENGNPYPEPLKGRAWVSQNTGQVMHLETDLLKPISEIQLKREHIVIDYEPVPFKTHKVTLWLPVTVDVYRQYRGHYTHHYHHFTNFKLFWTGATQKIGQPKGLKDKATQN